MAEKREEKALEEKLVEEKPLEEKPIEEQKPEPEAEAPDAPAATPGYEERDATLDDEPAMSADEVQRSILDDSDMNGFQKFCARMDDRRWTLAQRVAGALLGVATGVALFWDTLTHADPNQQRGFFSMPLVIAIVLALAVPNIIEKQSLRSVPKLRIAMVIALAVVIVIYFLVLGVQTGFKFTA